MKKNLNEVLEMDSRYQPENKNPKSEAKKEVLNRINKRIDSMKAALYYFVFITVLSFSFASCERNPDMPQPTKEMITQEFTLTNVQALQMKSFDPSTWVYVYNPNAYVITFTNTQNPSETVTKSVTIAELQEGISINLFAGVYNISYATASSTTDKLDIQINMNNVNISGTPISLSATYADYLLVVDMPNIQSVIDSQGYFTFNLYNGFYYAYYPINDPSQEIWITFNDQTEKRFNLGGKTCGHIYWYTSPINAGTNITFPEWIVDKISL
jgi:hypothetical protein